MSSEVLVDALIAATGVMIIAWLASLAMRRAPAALRNSVWRAALVGLWLAPALVIAARLLHVQPRELAVPVLPAADWTELETTGEAPAPVPSTSLAAPSTAVSPGAAGHPEGAAPDVRTSSRPYTGLGAVLLTLWVLGAAVGLVALARDLMAARRLAQRSVRVADPALAQRIAHWAERVGLRHSPAAVESAEIGVPSVMGWRRPRLLLPPPSGEGQEIPQPSRETASRAPLRQGYGGQAGSPTYGEDSDAEDSDGGEAAIVHELAHVRRGDLGVQAAARLTRALWWWHPLVWLAAKELRRTAEEACDDWVIALTGAREQYAEVLVQWAEAAQTARGLGCASRGRALVERVRRIVAGSRIPIVRLSRWTRAGLAVGTIGVVLAASGLRVRAVGADAALRLTGEQMKARILDANGFWLQPAVRTLSYTYTMESGRNPEKSWQATVQYHAPGPATITPSEGRKFEGTVDDGYDPENTATLPRRTVLLQAMAFFGPLHALRMAPEYCDLAFLGQDTVGGRQARVLQLRPTEKAPPDMTRQWDEKLRARATRPEYVYEFAAAVQEIEGQERPVLEIECLFEEGPSWAEISATHQADPGRIRWSGLIISADIREYARVVRPVVLVRWDPDYDRGAGHAVPIQLRDDWSDLPFLSRRMIQGVSLRTKLGEGEELFDQELFDQLKQEQPYPERWLPMRIGCGIWGHYKGYHGGGAGVDKLWVDKATGMVLREEGSSKGEHRLVITYGDFEAVGEGRWAPRHVVCSIFTKRGAERLEDKWTFDMRFTTVGGKAWVLERAKLYTSQGGLCTIVRVTDVEAQAETGAEAAGFRLEFYLARLVEDEDVEVPERYRLFEHEGRRYLAEGEAVATDRDIARTRLRENWHSREGDQLWEPVVLFDLNEQAAARFQQVTGENVGRPMLIVLNGEVVMAPVIRTAIPGVGVIEGMTQEQLRLMAAHWRWDEPPEPAEGTVTIKVTARFADGARPEHAECRITKHSPQAPRMDDAERARWLKVRPKVVGASGDWVIYNVLPDQWGVQVRGGNFPDTERKVVAVGKPGEEATVHFALMPGGTVTGRVVSAETSEPIEDVLVMWRALGKAGMTDVEGRYTLRHAAAGSGRVRPMAQGFCLTESEDVPVRDGETTAVADMKLVRGGWIAGEVALREKLGEPGSGWLRPVAEGEVRPGVLIANYPLPRDGSFKVGPLPAGPYRLRASILAGPDRFNEVRWRGESESVRVEVGETTEGVVIEVRRAGQG